jgi:hypothetical protein
VSRHLAPFALIPAFPDFMAGRYSGGYYEASVTVSIQVQDRRAAFPVTARDSSIAC